ncbi:MAG: two-component regulator propeller domain-containing protein [Bacteroidota bacterium]
MRLPTLMLLAFISLQVNSTFAQFDTRPGDWKTYLSYNNALQIAARDELLYVITESGLFTYNDQTQEGQTYSTIDGLSGVNPNNLFLEPNTGQFFIGYQDGTVDYFEDPRSIRVLSDIARNEFFTQKAIQDFASDGERLLVATDFGLVAYDLNSFRTAFTTTQFGNLPSKEPVLSVEVYQGRIYVAMGDNGVYSASINSLNLTDPNAWVAEDMTAGLPPDNFQQFAVFNGGLLVRMEEAIYQKRDGNWAPFSPLNRRELNIRTYNGTLTAVRGGRVTLVNSNNEVNEISLRSGSTDAISIGNGVAFVSNDTEGLYRVENGESTIVTPNGPTSNNCIRVVAGNGELYIAPRGYDNLFNPVSDRTGIYYFNPSRGGWKNLVAGDGLPENRANDKFARAYYDPISRRAYIGSWGKGLVVLREGELEQFFDCSNSGLSVIFNCDSNLTQETRVSGIGFSPDGRLWASHSFGSTPLANYDPRTGEWRNLPSQLFPNINMIDMLVDDFGSQWIINRGIGVVVYNDQGTPDDLTDDTFVTLREGLNRGDLKNDRVTALAKDQEGFVWVGTATGVVVFFDPFSLSRGELVDGTCPIFEGFCLLRDEQVNAIAVDGGNRKWLATNNGVFLVNEDGDQVIRNFTASNSPLLSDNVNDIAIDGTTGEIFFATDAGLISYRGDATDGKDGCQDVLVFPNPVLGDFDGNITIQGSAANSTVKITTVSGYLVREIEAQGGTATWDGRDVRGNKVRSGIYLALIAQDDGESACVGKFSIINN